MDKLLTVYKKDEYHFWFEPETNLRPGDLISIGISLIKKGRSLYLMTLENTECPEGLGVCPTESDQKMELVREEYPDPE